MRSLQLSRGNSLGYNASLDLDIHPPIRDTLGIFHPVGSSTHHPVGLISVALPEHASWGNLKTPSNFCHPSRPGRVLQTFDILHLFLNKVIARLSVHSRLDSVLNAMLAL